VLGIVVQPGGRLGLRQELVGGWLSRACTGVCEIRPAAETVFDPYGVGRRPVSDTAGNELSTVVQLVVDEAVSVVTDGLAGDSCPPCARMKYLPVVRGPALVAGPNHATVRTQEYLGSGGSAYSPS
jgi:hypothetical protein